MIKIGITGGIGSGKTYICHMFEQLNIPIYNADNRAKKLMNEHPKLIEEISKEFGRDAYQNHKLNRPFLASIVFNDKSRLKKLNRIVHPAVAQDYDQWCVNHTAFPYTIKEAALLFETEMYKKLDKTILVHAKKDIRILRVMQRDNVSKEAVESRMKNQLSDIHKMQLADYILHNGGSNEIFAIIQKLHTLFNPSIAV